MGSFFTRKKAPFLHTHRTGLFRPTTALPTPPVGIPASPWVWAKARSVLGALIRLCGDGAASNEAKMGSFDYTRKRHPSYCTHNRAVSTHHRTPDAPRWRSRLALDVGEGQKRARCIDSPVRRRGAASNESKMGSFDYTRKKTPLLHTHRTGLFRPTTALPRNFARVEAMFLVSACRNVGTKR
jgi:hypothetical protein